MFREHTLKDFVEYYKSSTDKLLSNLNEKERKDLAIEHYMDFLDEEKSKINEISKKKAQKYIGYASRDMFNLGKRDQMASAIDRLGGSHPDQDYQKGPERKAAKRIGGIDRATKILMKDKKKKTPNEAYDYKGRGPTGVAYAKANPIHMKEIGKLVKHDKFKGNTSGLINHVKKNYPELHKHPSVQKAFQKHAETNESVEEKYTERQKIGRDAGRNLGPAGKEYVKARMKSGDADKDYYSNLKRRQHKGRPGATSGMGSDADHDTSSRPQDKLSRQPDVKTRLKNKKSMSAFQSMRQRSQGGSGRNNMGGVGVRESHVITVDDYDPQGMAHAHKKFNVTKKIHKDKDGDRIESMMGGHKVSFHGTKENLKAYADEHLGGEDQVKIKAKTKMNTESVELGESTNWKGSKTVSLSRYSAKQGFGVQLSQLKAMPGERIPVSGIHIKMPLKEIPQLIKGLQNVYKAKTNVQLGDDD